MDAVKEFKWFVVIVIVLGITWITSGGLRSATKTNPLIKPAEPLSTGESYGKSIFSFTSPRTTTRTNIARQTSNVASLPVTPNAQITRRGSTKTYYGAEALPPLSTSLDYLKITKVQRTSKKDGTVGNEYVTIKAPTTNTMPILLTGMLLKSRMEKSLLVELV